MKEQRSYNVGIYCRLSRDDGDSGTSSSIQTQKKMLEKYVHDNAWNVFDIYVDDGYTGTNFNRPAFQRMIEDIEAGKVNLVAVKDLSRLGRDYIQTGQYTDIYFPDRGVRFIALNDGVDSLKSDNEILPFKNILNQMYAADISKKMRSSIRTRQQNGEFTSTLTPMGYQRDPVNKGRLIVEEHGAAIIRRIFELARAGHGGRAICTILSNEGVPTPLHHRRWLIHGILPPKPIRWHGETIVYILRNRVYAGDTVQGIYNCVPFRRTPPKRKPKGEWIITEGTHEPLVDRETWELIQKQIDARHRPRKSGTLQLFSGFLKCADCGRAMSYSSSYNANPVESYSCGTYRRNGRRGCTAHYIRKDVLEQVILDDIRKYAKVAKSEADKLAQWLRDQNGEKDASHLKTLVSELKRLSGRTAEIERILKRLYEDNVNAKLPDDVFHKFLTEYRQEQLDVQAKIADTEQQIKMTEANKKDTGSWMKLIQKHTRIKKLDRTVLSELVDKITISDSQIVNGGKVTDVTIYYRFVGAIG